MYAYLRLNFHMKYAFVVIAENIPTALPKVLAVDRKLCCYGNNAETLAHSRRSRDDSQHH